MIWLQGMVSTMTIYLPIHIHDLNYDALALCSVGDMHASSFTYVAAAFFWCNLLLIADFGFLCLLQVVIVLANSKQCSSVSLLL